MTTTTRLAGNVEGRSVSRLFAVQALHFGAAMRPLRFRLVRAREVECRNSSFVKGGYDAPFYTGDRAGRGIHFLPGAPAAVKAGGYDETDLVANKSGLTDKNGIVHNAKVTDPNLQNPWGVAESSGSPF